MRIVGTVNLTGARLVVGEEFCQSWCNVIGIGKTHRNVVVHLHRHAAVLHQDRHGFRRIVKATR